MSGAPESCDARRYTQATLTQLLDIDQPYKCTDQLDDQIRELLKKGVDKDKLQRIQGCLVGLAVGDALGASVEFRPNAYLKENEVKDMLSGGTWGLEKGQWTDDTSMALCLAVSLIIKAESNTYDQFERYKRWFRKGYLSSTGKCFDIGKSTREAIIAFEDCQKKIQDELRRKNKNLNGDELDKLTEQKMREDRGKLTFSTDNSAGNGALMRLAPIPCFFVDSYEEVKKCIVEATEMTHADKRAVQACQFYAGLIWHALNGTKKDELLSQNFYQQTLKLSGLDSEIQEIVKGSYKTKNDYEGGIRGKGYVVQALEAALWAFYRDNDDFNRGVLLAVNLGDDTDTTAAIYGQLAGACYKIDSIRKDWRDALYEARFITNIATGLYVKRHNSQRSEWPERNPNPDNRHSKPETEGRQQHRNLGPNASPSSAEPEHKQRKPNPNQPDQTAGSASSDQQQKGTFIIPET